MAESDMKTAKELVKRAQKSIPDKSTGRLALVAVATALVELVDAMRVIAKAHAPEIRVATREEVRDTVGALAAEPPPGVRGLSRCRTCNAPIYWVKTSNGKNMPIDAVPSEQGEWGVANGVVSKAFAGPKYTSHFATCPDAATHRRPRG